MTRPAAQTVKADFHLHTYHSDNRDRMTVDEYARRACDLGYGALGFCDHHHNLTQEAWATLRAEVAAASAAPNGENAPLLTTGYEATYMTGHLCVLGKQRFDGESIADCARAMWSPSNTRILAHPDNNICDWRMLLPIGVQGVEVINGGQDPYSVRWSSFCNGLRTFTRYLMLNQRVAAIAQSDCHERAIFGRVRTELLLREDEPLSWDSLRAALEQAHTVAVMEDLPLRVWADDGSLPGDTLTDAACDTLHWEAPAESEVTLYVAHRPVAHFAAHETGPSGAYPLRVNGPHWLLAQRGLAWAVSSPIWVQNRNADARPLRAALAQNSVVRQAQDALAARLDWLRDLQPWWAATVYPVDAYDAWLTSLLPEQWPDTDTAFSADATQHGDPTDWAMLRLRAARAMADTLLAEICRARAQAESTESSGSHMRRRLLIAAPDRVPAGVYIGTLEAPRDWETLHLLADGRELPSMTMPLAGERDPLHGPRSREQMQELVLWLERGEIHEYYLRAPQLTIASGRVSLTADLWPAALGGKPEPRPDLAQRLIDSMASPDIAEFFVHLRMPRRFGLAFTLDESTDRSHRTLEARPGAGIHSARILDLPPDAQDRMARALIVQTG